MWLRIFVDIWKTHSQEMQVKAQADNCNNDQLLQQDLVQLIIENLSESFRDLSDSMKELDPSY